MTIFPRRPSRILGIGGVHHDATAALVEDGKVVAIREEERLTRVKKQAGYPKLAIESCLRETDLGFRGDRYDCCRIVLFQSWSVRVRSKEATRTRGSGCGRDKEDGPCATLFCPHSKCSLPFTFSEMCSTAG